MYQKPNTASQKSQPILEMKKNHWDLHFGAAAKPETTTKNIRSEKTAN